MNTGLGRLENPPPPTPHLANSNRRQGPMSNWEYALIHINSWVCSTQALATTIVRSIYTALAELVSDFLVSFLVLGVPVTVSP
jgi:hypothetical protein